MNKEQAGTLTALGAALLLLCGCPVYDLPQDAITIDNQTDSTFYVYQTCGDSIAASSSLILFWENSVGTHDTPQGKATEKRAPRYRLTAFDYGELLGLRNGDHLSCSDNDASFFFISEKTMREKSWEEIHRSQLYEDKVVWDQEKLREWDWTVVYDP